MPTVIVDAQVCKGCELCSNACPQTVLGMSRRINTRGYFPAEVRDAARCIGCRICALVCPDVAIQVRSSGVHYEFYKH